jgi:hypothetical protein
MDCSSTAANTRKDSSRGPIPSRIPSILPIPSRPNPNHPNPNHPNPRPNRNDHRASRRRARRNCQILRSQRG